MRLGLLVLALLFAPLGAIADRVPIDVTGVYRSNWEEVRLVQRGDRVTGTYVCCGGGTIEGRITEGKVLRYRWKQPGAQGVGLWRVTSPDRLDGTWGVRNVADGGPWDLERASRQIAR